MINQEEGKYIAHVRSSDRACQSLGAHLRGVSSLASGFSAKFGLETHGRLIGLLHDLGKYGSDFQSYIQSAAGLLNQDEDEGFVDVSGLRGKIDHSTSGAQFIWKHLSASADPPDPLLLFAGQFMALCIASHHSGLIDCLTSCPGKPTEDTFSKRMGKADSSSHLREALDKADPEMLAEAERLLASQEITEGLRSWLRRALEKSTGVAADGRDAIPVFQFQLGLLVRALFSCLVDADRIDTADFERPGRARQRLNGRYASWPTLIDRLERHVAGLQSVQPIDALRRQISDHCLDAAERDTGIYTLTVPTGGGKTLASLRFALHHANKHSLDRIIYVIPFTSIIDQNAGVARGVLEPDGVEPGSVVLEHHSNLTPEKQSWRGKIISENWDAPVIYTTMVQLLEALFGSGTRGARRMHQLANAVLIFDEIQNLPVRCVHLFNNAMNFLADHCRSTIVLCTATQPLLGRVDPSKGRIRLAENHELMPDVHQLFDALERVDIHYRRKPGGWTLDEIAGLAVEQLSEGVTCLVIVNTKKAARDLYLRCLDLPLGGALIFHLSASMCPKHRKDVLDAIRSRLDATKPLPTLCISTQLIEAGVDVDFGCVIRSSAGLDSIAQAAGRCNRNGRLSRGRVWIVNPRDEDENLSHLPDIRVGREKAERVLDEYEANPERFGNNILGPMAMDWYYQNYFFDRAGDMSYAVPNREIGRDDTLLDLLSDNSLATNDYASTRHRSPSVPLRQSFMSAALAFRSIDAPTRGVIVPHGEEGSSLVAALCSTWRPEMEFEQLRLAQQYSVNVMPKLLETLAKAGAVKEIQEGTGVLFLADPRYYSSKFGLSDTPQQPMENHCV